MVPAVPVPQAFAGPPKQDFVSPGLQSAWTSLGQMHEVAPWICTISWPSVHGSASLSGVTAPGAMLAVVTPPGATLADCAAT
jgi:hypothetical protein